MASYRASQDTYLHTVFQKFLTAIISHSSTLGDNPGSLTSGSTVYPITYLIFATDAQMPAYWQAKWYLRESDVTAHGRPFD